MLGWFVLCLLTYFSLTIWYTTDAFLSNITHIFAQAVAGLVLSLLLRRVFLKLWDLRIAIRLLLAAVAIFATAMVWNIVRMQLFIWLVVSDEVPLIDHPEWEFNKASIFFDFGGDISNEQGNLYYWDNVYFGEVLLLPEVQANPDSNHRYSNGINLPLDFELPKDAYLLTDFGGAITSIQDDPNGVMGKVAVTRKWPNSLYWAGTTMSGATGFVSPIPLTQQRSKMTVWIYSQLPNVTVRLKLESHNNPEHAMEIEQTAAINGEWKPVVFDFNQARAGDYEHQVSQIWRDFGGWYYAAVLIFCVGRHFTI